MNTHDALGVLSAALRLGDGQGRSIASDQSFR
jgi:hypothetical protein